LADLVAKGALVRVGAKKASRYYLNVPASDPANKVQEKLAELDITEADAIAWARRGTQ
jgi:hypothetical protein